MIAPPPVPPYFAESAVAIRDFTYELLKEMEGFGGRVSKTPIFPEKDADLPAMEIKFGGEMMTSQSERGNQGSPKFDHDFTLLISIIASGESDIAVDGTILQMAEDVRQTLLTNYDWVNQSEGVTRFNTTIDYPRDADIFLCVVNIEIGMCFMSDWEPVVPHDLREINIKRTISPGLGYGVPTVTQLVPDSGYVNGGTPVTIIGTHLSSATAVTFGNTPALSFRAVDNETLNVVAPAGTGSATVTVTTPLGSATYASYFFSSQTGMGPGLLEDDIIFMGTDVIPPGT